MLLIIIILGAVFFALTVGTIILLINEEEIGLLLIFFCVVISIPFICCLESYISAGEQSKFWNKKYDTHYTTDEWIFNAETIKGEKLEIKNEKIHLQIEGIEK